MTIQESKLKNIIEAALMAVAKPMSVEQLLKLFAEDGKPSVSDIKDALSALQQECEGRGVELQQVASGYRYQARQDYSTWLSRLWEEKPAKYSRAYLETIALIAYRQPVTRSEIEEVRGVGVSSSIIKTMLEREWIRVVGHKDVPGRPSLYATTKQFLDYFNMKSLEELPSLAEIRDLDEFHPQLGASDSSDTQVSDAQASDTQASDTQESQKSNDDTTDLQDTTDPEPSVNSEESETDTVRDS